MLYVCCRVSEFAAQYSSKLGVRPDILHKTLRGDFYLEVKTKRIKKGAQVSIYCANWLRVAFAYR